MSGYAYASAPGVVFVSFEKPAGYVVVFQDAHRGVELIARPFSFWPAYFAAVRFAHRVLYPISTAACRIVCRRFEYTNAQGSVAGPWSWASAWRVFWKGQP